MSATLELVPSKPAKPAGKSRAREGVEPPPDGPDNQALLVKLGQLLNSDDLRAAVECWRDGLKAMRMVWNNKLGQYIEAGPDWQIRRDMSELIAAYMEGKPMERQMSISGSFEELGDMLQTLNASAEAVRLLPWSNSLPSTPDRSE